MNQPKIGAPSRPKGRIISRLLAVCGVAFLVFVTWGLVINNNKARDVCVGGGGVWTLIQTGGTCTYPNGSVAQSNGVPAGDHAAACATALTAVNDVGSAVAAVAKGRNADGPALIDEMSHAVQASRGLSPLQEDLHQYQLDAIAALGSATTAEFLANIQTLLEDRTRLGKDCGWTTG